VRSCDNVGPLLVWIAPSHGLLVTTFGTKPVISIARTGPALDSKQLVGCFFATVAEPFLCVSDVVHSSQAFARALDVSDGMTRLRLRERLKALALHRFSVSDKSIEVPNH
jgi:hypothetical protein